MRDRFLLPPDLAYFNAAHMSLLPRTAFDSGTGAIGIRAAPWSNSGAEVIAEDLRDRFGRLVGAPCDTIALAPSTSYVMAGTTTMFPLRSKAFLHLEDEHPSAVMPWLRAAAGAEAPVCSVARPVDGDWTTAVLDHIGSNIAVACLPHCHWLDGAALDLVAIGAALRSVGARLIVDATQSAGARAIDVERVRPDILVASGYKWLFGPMGVAYAYIAPEHNEAAAFEDGFVQRDGARGWFDATGAVDYALPRKSGARRFDAGGMFDPVKLGMARAGLGIFDEVPVDEIERTLIDRAGTLIAAHPDVPFASGATASHILSFRPPSPGEVAAAFDRGGVRVSRRGPHIRLSGHLWNDAGDLERLSTVLADLPLRF